MATKKGFTLVELLVVVAIIALLVSILLPALGSARKQAKLLLCATRQRTIVQGVNLYECDWNGKQPPSTQGKGYWKDPSQPTWWTRPMRLRYYYKSTSVTPLNGGCVFAILGDYLRDTSNFSCPLSPSQGDAVWQEGYIANNGDSVESLNNPYLLLWSYGGFEDYGFMPTKLHRGSVMVTDTLFWGSNAVQTVYGGEQWVSSHPFKGASAKPFWDGNSSPYLLSEKDQYYLRRDDTGLDVPDVELNAGYHDGHVETYSSCTEGRQVGAGCYLPTAW